MKAVQSAAPIESGWYTQSLWRDMYKYSRGSGLLFLVLSWVLLLPPPCLRPEEPAEGLMEMTKEN